MRSSRVGVVTGLVVAVLSTLWAFASPLMSIPDETAHTSKLLAVTSGQLLGDLEDLSVTQPDGGLVGRVSRVTIPAPYGEVRGLMDCYAQRIEVSADCATPLPDVDGTVSVVTSAGTYAPLYYLAVGLPTQVLDPPAALYASRVLGAVVAGVLLGVAAAAVHRATGSLLTVVAVAAATTPVTLFVAGGINPSGMELPGAVALWATTALLVRPGDHARGWVWAWAAAVTAVAWPRPIGVFLVVGIVLATVVAVGDRTAMFARWAASRRAVLAGAASLTGALVWIVATDANGSFKGIPQPDLTTADAIAASWDLTPWRLEQLVGVLGWVDTTLPHVTLWTLGLVAVGLVVGGLVVGTWRERLVLVGLVLASLLLPVAAEAVQAPRIGFGWQGRYTLPVPMGAVVLGGLALGRRLDVRLATLSAVATGVFLSVGHLYAFAGALRRYVVGGFDPRPFWAFLRVDTFDPPGGVVPLVVLYGVTLAVTGLALARAGWRVLAGAGNRRE